MKIIKEGYKKAAKELSFLEGRTNGSSQLDKIIADLEIDNPEMHTAVKEESSDILSDHYLCTLFKLNYASPGNDDRRRAGYAAYIVVRYYKRDVKKEIVEV